MGFCYSQIRNYCDKPVMGLMAQGFKQAIEKELQEYYRLLAVIQGRVSYISNSHDFVCLAIQAIRCDSEF